MLTGNIRYKTYSVNADASNLGIDGGRYNKIGRGYPDVSANGANLLAFVQQGLGHWYGTSLAAPIWAAVVTLVSRFNLLLSSIADSLSDSIPLYRSTRSAPPTTKVRLDLSTRLYTRTHGLSMTSRTGRIPTVAPQASTPSKAGIPSPAWVLPIIPS